MPAFGPINFVTSDISGEKWEKKKKIKTTTPNPSESEMCLLSAQKNKEISSVQSLSHLQRSARGKIFCRTRAKLFLDTPHPPKNPTPQSEMLIPPESVRWVFKTISWAATRLLFISFSPPLRKSTAMLRASSVRVATPKTQANTFPPPPSNSRAATAGTVLHCPAELCASSRPVFVCEAARSWPQRYGCGPRGPRVNTRPAPAPSWRGQQKPARERSRKAGGEERLLPCWRW